MIIDSDKFPEGIIIHYNSTRIHKLINGKSQKQVSVECSVCHGLRWVAIVNLKNGHTKTGLCRACYLQKGNLSPLIPEEVSIKDAILFFDRQELIREKGGDQKQMLRILAECPDCHKQRWIRINSFRNGKTKSTVCSPCSRRRQPKRPAKGTYDANGYRMIHLEILPPEDRALAEQYLKVHRRHYVYEHRLVALKTYGPMAAAPGVVIRHVNGDKMCNTPENLIPGTQSDNARDHVEAIAEMEAWRALALFLLQRVHSP